MRVMALAAPVVVGTMLTVAARARRRSLCGASCRRWSPVKLCTVVMKPSSMPQSSWMPRIMGAAQLVVQLALLMMGSSPFRMRSFTPSTTLGISASLAGAERITRFAPALRCAPADARVRKWPVLSMTASMPSAFHGSAEGSFAAKAFTLRLPR